MDKDNKKQMELANPLPKKKNRRHLNVWVDKTAYEAMMEICKREDLFMTDAINWSVRQFVIIHNPKEAKRLGLTKE